MLVVVSIRAPGDGAPDCDAGPGLARALCHPPADPVTAVGNTIGQTWQTITSAAAGAWSAVTGHGPVGVALGIIGTAVTVAVMVACGLGVAAGWRRVHGRRMAARARGAVWLSITPPAHLTAAGAVAAWRVLAGALDHARRPLRPAPVISAEVWTVAPTPDTDTAAGGSGLVQVGVWVPSSVAADRVAAGLSTAWPGARVERATPPEITPSIGRGSVVAMDVAPRGGPWEPLLDPRRSDPRRAPVTGDGEESLRGLFAALADLRHTHPDGRVRAGVQIVVTPHRAPRARSGGWADDPSLASLTVGSVGLSLALSVVRIVLALVDALMPRGGGASRSSGTGRAARATRGGRRRGGSVGADMAAMTDAALMRDRARKHAAGPHVVVTARAVVIAPDHDRRYAFKIAADIAAQLDGAVIPRSGMRHRLIRRAAPVAGWRCHTRTRRRFIATLPEVAALWHLPADGARYGLPTPPARTRPPAPGLPTYRPGMPQTQHPTPVPVTQLPVTQLPHVERHDRG